MTLAMQSALVPAQGMFAKESTQSRTTIKGSGQEIEVKAEIMSPAHCAAFQPRLRCLLTPKSASSSTACRYSARHEYLAKADRLLLLPYVYRFVVAGQGAGRLQAALHHRQHGSTAPAVHLCSADLPSLLQCFALVVHTMF
jgi:hypothetical protein